MSFDKTNTGTLGKNKRREKETHPEYSGEINVDGSEYWLSAFIRTNGKTGEKFFALSVRKKVERPAEQPKSTDVPFDDDLPF